MKWVFFAVTTASFVVAPAMAVTLTFDVDVTERSIPIADGTRTDYRPDPGFVPISVQIAYEVDELNWSTDRISHSGQISVDTKTGSAPGTVSGSPFFSGTAFVDEFYESGGQGRNQVDVRSISVPSETIFHGSVEFYQIDYVFYDTPEASLTTYYYLSLNHVIPVDAAAFSEGIGTYIEAHSAFFPIGTMFDFSEKYIERSDTSTEVDGELVTNQEILTGAMYSGSARLTSISEIQAVPAPGALGLLGLGFASLAVLRRGRIEGISGKA